jgi:hypothetical protein
MDLSTFIQNKLKEKGFIPEFPEDQTQVIGDKEKILETIIEICEEVAEKQKLYCAYVGVKTEFNIIHCRSATLENTY